MGERDTTMVTEKDENKNKTGVIGVVETNAFDEALESLLENLSDRQRIFILSYLKTWSIAAACREAGVTRAAVYNKWLNNEAFKKTFDEAREMFLDVLEDKLFAWLDEKRDVRTLLDILKIRGRGRGWGEDINVNHGGVVRVEFIDRKVEGEHDNSGRV